MLGLFGGRAVVPHHYVIGYVVSIIILNPPADVPVLRLRLMGYHRRSSRSWGLNLGLRSGWLSCWPGRRRSSLYRSRAKGHLLLHRRQSNVRRQR